MNPYDDVIDRLSTRVDSADRRRTIRTLSYAVSAIRALQARGHDPDDVGDYFEQYATALDRSESTERALRRGISRTTTALLTYLEKQHGLVPPGHYRAQWMAIGMAAFGVPIGTAIGVVLDNMGLIGVGIPLGMVVGMAIGSGKDDAAAKDGLQLDMEEQ